MEWTEQQITELETMRLRSKRGGYDTHQVDLLVSNAIACMKARRPLPDPESFALPTSLFGTGYARADVRHLLDRLNELRGAGQARPAPSAEPAASSTPQAPAGGPHWTHAQMDWVRDQKFSMRRGGYDIEDVDDFLDAVLVAMAHGKPLPDVRAAKFATSGFARGYNYSEVDDFLDELLAQQPQHE